ncbi:MAG TPA: type VI secretion system-associated protein TagF [Acetobacteraceae bacterium]|nr:type VI secretion system-associated protein TagF [Acetobacteraceae bacterium]
MSTYPVTGSITGFWGKLPARGDFVRVGLSRGFLDAWDAWFCAVIAAAQEQLAEDWAENWLVAPVWRFALSADLCGPHAVLGLWMPSVDRAGRHFPLTIAAEVPGVTASHLAAAGSAWLDAAEAAGRAALAEMLAPEELMARLPPFSAGASDEQWDAESLWWTEGSPHVDAQQLALPTLPFSDQFIRMIAGAERRDAVP